MPIRNAFIVREAFVVILFRGIKRRYFRCSLVEYMLDEGEEHVEDKKKGKL